MDTFVAPLPVTEFDAFAAFAKMLPPLTAGVDRLRWTFAEAAAAAASVVHALGHPSVFEEPAADQEERALRWWLSRLDSREWQADSEALIRSPGGGDNAMTFAWDEPGRGWGEAAWRPDYRSVKRFNTWCRAALGAFWQAQRSESPAGNPNPETSRGVRLRQAPDDAIREAFNLLPEWANMFGDPSPPDKRTAGRQVHRFLVRQGLRADPSEIERIAEEPRYAERRRKRGRPVKNPQK